MGKVFPAGKKTKQGSGGRVEAGWVIWGGPRRVWQNTILFPFFCAFFPYQSIDIMGNCSSGCATGCGIAQLVIGVWFVGLTIFSGSRFDFEVGTRIVQALVSALFVSSGSLAIAGALLETLGLQTAAFILSILCALVALGLLIFVAKIHG